MYSILAPFSTCSKTRFKVSLKSGKARSGFLKLVLYSCNIPGFKDMSSIRNEAGKYHSCVRCAISFDNTVQGKKGPNILLSATIETRRNVESLKETAEMVRKRGPHERGWALKEISNFWSE